MRIDNPYWEAVKDCVETDSFRGNPVVGEFRLDRTLEQNMARFPNRQRLVRKYCWTIPDPDTVAFVAKHAQGGLVDPIAGTVLGVDVGARYHLYCSDITRTFFFGPASQPIKRAYSKVLEAQTKAIDAILDHAERKLIRKHLLDGR